METEIFTLCDFAQDVNGKLTIVGTFDHVNTPSIPFILPTCSIALKLRFPNSAVGIHNIEVRLQKDNKDVIPSIKLNANVHQGPVGYSTATLVLGLNNLRFNSEGKHTIQLLVDGEWKSGLSFFLRKTASAA